MRTKHFEFVLFLARSGFQLTIQKCIENLNKKEDLNETELATWLTGLKEDSKSSELLLDKLMWQALEISDREQFGCLYSLKELVLKHTNRTPADMFLPIVNADEKSRTPSLGAVERLLQHPCVLDGKTTYFDTLLSGYYSSRRDEKEYLFIKDAIDQRKWDLCSLFFAYGSNRFLEQSLPTTSIKFQTLITHCKDRTYRVEDLDYVATLTTPESLAKQEKLSDEQIKIVWGAIIQLKGYRNAYPGEAVIDYDKLRQISIVPELQKTFGIDRQIEVKETKVISTSEQWTPSRIFNVGIIQELMKSLGAYKRLFENCLHFFNRKIFHKKGRQALQPLIESMDRLHIQPDDTVGLYILLSILYHPQLKTVPKALVDSCKIHLKKYFKGRLGYDEEIFDAYPELHKAILIDAVKRELQQIHQINVNDLQPNKLTIDWVLTYISSRVPVVKIIDSQKSGGTEECKGAKI